MYNHQTRGTLLQILVEVSSVATLLEPQDLSKNLYQEFSSYKLNQGLTRPSGLFGICPLKHKS